MFDALFPAETQLVIEAISIEDDQMTITLASDITTGCCSACGQTSARVHSRYVRRPADLPCLGHAVHLHLQVRRFFCDNQHCTQVTFAEQFAGLVAPKQRRTSRLSMEQVAVALECGGEAGKRLLSRQRMRVSATTLLKGMRALPESRMATPRVLGIDDWAQRKGRRYGTILVDLETHRPIDVLPDREVETVVTWLRDHPGIEIISRDRGKEYIKAIEKGAPNATVVADRWHLLVNLRQAAQELLATKVAARLAAASIPEAMEKDSAGEEQPGQLKETTRIAVKETTNPLCRRPTKAQQQRAARHSRRQARFETVHHLHQSGSSIADIRRQTQLAYRTVKRYLALDECPQYTRSADSYQSKLRPFMPYIERRWQAGCTNATQLYREIQAQGFTGSRNLVAHWAVKQRGHLPPETRYARQQPPKIQPKLQRQQQPRPLSAAAASWLLIKDMAKMDEEEVAARQRLIDVDSQVATTADLVARFAEMVRQRKGQKLIAWLQSAATSNIESMVSFANGILADLSAVTNALTLPWSQGQVEGQVNRLKFLKRQMYGRANFDLLRLRVLHRAV